MTLEWLLSDTDTPALIEAAYGRTMSYADLARAAHALACVLEQRGRVRAGDRVAILCRTRSEVFEALYACARLGAVLVPLNWRLSQRELRGILDDCAPRVLIFDREHERAARDLAAVSGTITAAMALDTCADGAEFVPYPRPSRTAEMSAWRPPPPEHPAMILYTSGTTGTPKGAMLAWRQIAANAAHTRALCDLGPADRTLVFLPLFHTGGLHCLATPILSAGGTVVLMREFDARAAISAMAEHRITAIIAVPTIYEMLLAAGIGDATLGLRWLLMGGAPPAPALFERYQAVGYALNQGYGLTEVGPNCFTLGMGAPAGSVGGPVAGTEALLIDDAGAAIDGPGVGELCLRGPHVTLGYWQKPEETARALDARGFFHTGDIARRDDQGWYYIVGRKKDMYISGGENVYPAEIERVLLEHPAVAEAAVIGVPDERWGEVGLAVVALSSPSPDMPGDDDSLARMLGPWVRERLAGYKVPRRWHRLPELPRTPTGKVAKAELGRRFKQRSKQ